MHGLRLNLGRRKVLWQRPFLTKARDAGLSFLVGKLAEGALVAEAAAETRAQDMAHWQDLTGTICRMHAALDWFPQKTMLQYFCRITARIISCVQKGGRPENSQRHLVHDVWPLLFIRVREGAPCAMGARAVQEMLLAKAGLVLQRSLGTSSKNRRCQIAEIT